jgi:heme exporter protein CcmD
MPVLDKYGPYILAAYAVAILLIGGLTLWSILRAINARKKFEALEREEQSGDSAP